MGEPPAEDGAVSRERLEALEQRVAAMAEELAYLSLRARHAGFAPDADAARGAQSPSPAVVAALRQPPLGHGSAGVERPALSDRLHASTGMSGDELESIVGRYGTLALAAMIILMAVGAVIKMAVERGLLTPEVRVAAGALAAAGIAGAGAYFRHRGERRYGNVLLAIALAIVDLVAWGMGPRFHLMPTSAALVVVDVASVALASLALHDDSEFLFAVSVAGALSAPFVTSDGGGTALGLLLYGGVVLAGGLRAAHDAAWMRAFAVLVAGAFAYAVTASWLPVSVAWYGPFLVTLFAGACSLAALMFGEPGWRSELPRAYLAVGLIGVLTGWDAVRSRPLLVALGVALCVAATTYAALFARRAVARHWTLSAVLLPFLSLAVGYPAAAAGGVTGAVCAAWTVLALAAWRVERSRGEWRRSGAHLLTGGLLGCVAITAWLWLYPLPLVCGLAGWGVGLAMLGRAERSSLPLAGISVTIGAAAISAFDQLASRSAYSYVPFATRSSASAGVALLGIGVSGWVIGTGAGGAGELANRSVRLSVLIGFAILWGRMEVANAGTPDLAAFLLTSYYAACGVASIVAGRRLEIGRLRVGGLVLSMYAAVKAVVVVTDIGSVLLRVGAWAAVGMFLLGAGYLYRDAKIGLYERHPDNLTHPG